MSILKYTIRFSFTEEDEEMTIHFDVDAGSYTSTISPDGQQLTARDLEEWVESTEERITIGVGTLYEYLDWLPEQ